MTERNTTTDTVTRDRTCAGTAPTVCRGRMYRSYPVVRFDTSDKRETSGPYSLARWHCRLAQERPVSGNTVHRDVVNKSTRQLQDIREFTIRINRSLDKPCRDRPVQVENVMRDL